MEREAELEHIVEEDIRRMGRILGVEGGEAEGFDKGSRGNEKERKRGVYGFLPRAACHLPGLISAGSYMLVQFSKGCSKSDRFFPSLFIDLELFWTRQGFRPFDQSCHRSGVSYQSKQEAVEARTRYLQSIHCEKPAESGKKNEQDWSSLRKLEKQLEVKFNAWRTDLSSPAQPQISSFIVKEGKTLRRERDGKTPAIPIPSRPSWVACSVNNLSITPRFLLPKCLILLIYRRQKSSTRAVHTLDYT